MSSFSFLRRQAYDAKALTVTHQSFHAWISTLQVKTVQGVWLSQQNALQPPDCADPPILSITFQMERE